METHEYPDCTIIIEWTKPEDDPVRFTSYCQTLLRIWSPVIEERVKAA